MGNALAISGVTAVLQYFLNIVYNDPLSPLGSVSVSAIAPDIVQTNLGSGGNSQLQVNLFLHQVTHNAAWRNVGLPSAAGDGSTRLNNPPLALDLHYMLTAYASEDTQAEALLGFAILMLHENPVLPRAQINTALTNLPATNPLAGALSSSGLADQIEMIKITPAPLGREEMAWIWTALKSDFRPTFAFDVSVVLIQSPLASSFALPVLSRNISAQAGAPAQLFEIQAPMGQTSSAPGDTVTVTGQFLAGFNQVALNNPRLGIRYPPFAPSVVTDRSIAFTVPNDPANLPAGVYSLAVLFTNGSGLVLQSSNTLPLALAPTIRAIPAPTAVTNALGTLVTLSCDPQALPNQSASLALGGTAAPAQAFDAPTATLNFQFPTLSPGSYLARLRVDGVESPVAVNWAATPPTFAGPFITV
jgi:hypothetical protein